MTSVCRFAVTLFALAAFARSAAAALPVVYDDQHIVVHAAITDAGSRPMNVGDRLTLAIEVVFDRNEVQVEALDEEYFQRAFSSLPAARLHESGRQQSVTDAAGRVHHEMRWHFQLLDCPDGMQNCPGLKRYELPLMTVGYRLTGGADGAEAGRSARFTPWPGSITLVPAIAFEQGAAADLSAIVPGGAWPAPAPVERAVATGPVLLAAGGLLLVSGFVAGNRRGARPQVAVSRQHQATRWERALARLEQPELSDEEFPDLMRRAVTWYCLDELGVNPVHWLDERDQRAPANPSMRALFLDVLTESGIAGASRGDYLARFREAAAIPPVRDRT